MRTCHGHAEIPNIDLPGGKAANWILAAEVLAVSGGVAFGRNPSVFGACRMPLSRGLRGNLPVGNPHFGRFSVGVDEIADASRDSERKAKVKNAKSRVSLNMLLRIKFLSAKPATVSP